MLRFFKKYLINILFIMTFVIGLLIFLYPFISNFVNMKLQTKEVSEYEVKIEKLTNDEYELMIRKAQEYNDLLISNTLEENTERAEERGYYNLLSLDDSGIMGYLEINKINVKLPIFHGSEKSVLQNGIGHMKGTSLPVENVSSHIVLAGHTGLPSAKLLTDLNKMEIGDIFEIGVLKYKFIYEVDQILVVEPNNTENLEIENGQQFATLVTCTPYGVNSHRLLVRGKLIEKK